LQFCLARIFFSGLYAGELRQLLPQGCPLRIQCAFELLERELPRGV
jgi:hypothetical protein